MTFAGEPDPDTGAGTRLPDAVADLERRAEWITVFSGAMRKRSSSMSSRKKCC